MVRNMASKEETHTCVDELNEKIGKRSEYVFYTPQWDPVDSKQGIWWVTSLLREGFYLDYRIDFDKKRVCLKSWEYGEQEPAWLLPTSGI